MQQVTSAQEYQNLAEELSQVVVLAKVRISRWRGKFSLKASKVTINDKEVADTTRLAPVRAGVLTEEFELSFGRLETALRAATKKYALLIKSYMPYKTADGKIEHQEVIESDDCIVPKKFADRVRAEIEEIKINQWDPLVEKFVANYDAVIEEFKKTSPILYTELAHKLPKSGEAVRQLFMVRYSERPLGINADDLTRETIERGAGDYLKAIQESIFRQPVENLKANISTILEILNRDNGVVNKRTIENTLHAFEIFKSVGSLMPTVELTGIIKEAENLLETVSIKELNMKDNNFMGASKMVSEVLGKLAGAIDADDMLSKASARRQRKIAI